MKKAFLQMSMALVCGGALVPAQAQVELIAKGTLTSSSAGAVQGSFGPERDIGKWGSSESAGWAGFGDCLCFRRYISGGAGSRAECDSL